MATIKSYTDIEQSRKLAEILPFESADMCYQHFVPEFFKEGYCPSLMKKEEDDDVPCWSLAALLSLIPQEIFDGEYIINITEGRSSRWIVTYDHYKIRDHSYYSLSIDADNLIDICYELILKLHKLNIL